MNSAASPTARRPARAPRPSLSATVFRLTAVTLVAAVLVWSVLLINFLVDVAYQIVDPRLRRRAESA